MAVVDTEGQDPAPERRRVLLVEDDPSVGETLAAVLDRNGCRTTLVASVALALARLREQEFDAVVSDLLLDDDEGRTGFAVLAEAKRLWPDVTRILITAFPSTASRRRADEEGVTGLLVKPLEIGELLALLERRAASPA